MKKHYKIPKIFKNIYFILTVIIFFWVFIIGDHNLFTQWELNQKRKELLQQKEYYDNKIIEVKNDDEALLNNEYNLEKIAREKYLMKKKDEDLFIIKEK